MITLYTFEQIEKVTTISEILKDELKIYFREIAEGMVGDSWQGYNLSEVGPILVIEMTDTIDILDEYGLVQGNKTVPVILPEFAIRIKVEVEEMLRIIWVCNDSFGLSVYYPVGQFGEEFDNWVKEYLID